MKTQFRAIAACFAAAFAFSAGAQTVEPYSQVGTKDFSTDAVKSQRAKATRVTEINLGVPATTFKAKTAADAGKMGVPLQVGFGRAVPGLERDVTASLDWDTTAAGTKVAAVSITSAGAAALRAGVHVDAMHPEAMLRFYSPYLETLFEVSGREILDTINRNVAADGDTADARTYWSPPLDAPTVVMEIELPGHVRASEVRIAVPNVTHMVTSASRNFVMPKEMIESAACENDATCSIGAWGAEMNSVARMTFQVGGQGYLCTGTLLANAGGATTPYFLTAHHCFSTQSSASSLTTYWFYRSNGCSTGALGASVTLTGGSTYLFGSQITDTSFVRLNNPPPAGAVFAGWSVTVIPLGTAVTGIHHPGGDLQKITFGTMTGNFACSAPVGGSFSCGSGATFYRASWSSGITEPGSSGSALFQNSGRYVVGQLYGGSSSCANISSGEFYGRLDVAYNAGINVFLAPAVPTNLLSVSKNGTGSGTVTSTPSGVSCGAACSFSFPETASVTLAATPAPGSLFAGWAGACSGTDACVVSMSAARSVTATFNPAPPVSLTVTKSGLGTGTITSNPSGINCGATCTLLFAANSTVTLSAAPLGGSSFQGWTGACTGTSTCEVTLNAASTVNAVFGPPPMVTVTKAGTGAGTVTSNVNGINCGPTCSAPFGQNSTVGLTAVATAGSTFAGWSGACAGTRGCTMTMNGDKAITATFNLAGTDPRGATFPLSVSLGGTGSGTVTSSPAGINCGATCTAQFTANSPVSLTPTAAGGSTFAGWTGACSGTGACSVPMSAAASVGASFNTSASPPPGGLLLTIVKAGTGGGTVTSLPAGIDCGATCSGSFASGTAVRLTAAPVTGATFGGWTGACVGSRTTCTVSITVAATVTATFNGTGATPPPPPTMQTLSVALAGTGSGSVASTPAGISCGATCSANFTTGTPVTLSPTAGSGSTFAGWSGACSGSGACVVTMNAAASVTATFNTSGGPTPPPPAGSSTLTVVKAGANAASGLVSSTPAGINCGTACAASFTNGTFVQLRATPGPGMTFGGWSGGCTGTRTTCTMPVNAATTVTATFN